MADLTQDEDFYFRIDDFLSGVHDFAVFDKTPINSLVKAKNLVFDKGGYLKRRPGLNQVGADFTPAAGLSHPSCIIMLSSSPFATARKLIATHLENVGTYKFGSFSGGAWTLFGTGLYGILNGFQVADGTVVRQSDGSILLYTSIGFASLSKVDFGAIPGVTIQSMTGRPGVGFRVITRHVDRIWLAMYNSLTNTNALLDYVVYSPAGVPEGIYDVANDANTIGFDGDRVVSLVAYRDTTLFVGTDRSLYLLLVGTSENLLDWQKSKVSAEIGVHSHATVAFINEDLIFVDQNGNVRSLKGTLYSLQGGVSPVPISYSIKGSLKAIIESDGLFSNAAIKDGLYLLNGHDGIPAGTNGQSWSFDTFFNAWTGPHVFETGAEVDFGSNVTASHACSTVESSYPYAATRATDIFLAVSSASATKVYKWDPTVFQDDTGIDGASQVAIPIELITRWHDFGAPHQEKLVKWVEVEYGDDDEGFSGVGAFMVDARTERSDSWQPLGSTAYDSTTKHTVTKYPMHSLGRSKRFQVRLRDSSNTDGPKLRRMRFCFQGQEIKDN